MEIGFIHYEYNGCAHWRMFEPAKFLNKKTDIKVRYFPKKEKLLGSLEEHVERYKGCDLLVSMRVANKNDLGLLLALRHELRIPLVFETDDNFLNVDKFNIAYANWIPGGLHYSAAFQHMEWSDMFQFSTFPLKQFFGYRFKKPTWVQPNLIDYASWSRLRKKNNTDEIRIAWAGSATHYGDLLLIQPVLERLISEYSNLKVVVCGMKADFIFEDKTGKVLKKGYELAEAKEFDEWGKALSSLRADIAIVPLDDVRFNKDKSNCRYLEWSSLKIPGVYSKIYPYEKTITDSKNGYLVNTRKSALSYYSDSTAQEKWYNNLKALIESKDLREEIGNNAFELVKTKYSLQNNIDIWANNYKEMLNTNVNLRDIDKVNSLLALR